MKHLLSENVATIIGQSVNANLIQLLHKKKSYIGFTRPSVSTAL